MICDYAVVEIQGIQFKLFKNKYVYVPHLSNKKPGKEILLNKVYIYYNNNTLKIGNPILNNFYVKVIIEKHIKGNKIIIFRKKRRKGFKKKNGFRQYFSKLRIVDFIKK